MQANSNKRSESSPPVDSDDPSAPCTVPGGLSSFKSVLSDLLVALDSHGKVATAVRRALGRYCDVTGKAGETYLVALDLTSRLEELVNRAIDDLECRCLSKVQR